VRSDTLWALLITAGVFGIYALGACPTIYVGDSGELTTAVAVLGIPHPTGYPLYVLLGALWTAVIPVGSIAWRMSLFSATCGALACGLLYRLGRRLDLVPVAAAFAALLLAVSPSVWAEATVQRVYTLNALFVVLATTLAVRWDTRRERSSLVAAFVCCGLGAANHAFMAIFAVALAIFVGWRARRAVATRDALWAGVAFLAGLAPYLYLPLRSRADPPLDWGNPETLRGFLDVVLRRTFWARAWLERPGDLVPIAADYLRSVGRELGWAGAALAAIGAVVAPRRWGGLVLLLGLVLLGNLAALALHGSRHDLFVWHRYYIPSYVVLALLAGLGCDLIVRALPRPLHLLPLAIPLLLLVGGWHEHDRSRYRIAEAFADLVLDSLPPGAHLAATDDNVLFAIMYRHVAEGRRPDVDLILQGVGGEMPPLRFDPDRDRLYFTHHPNWTLPALEITPVGVVFRVQRAGRPQPALPPLPDELPGEHDPRVPKDSLTRSLVAHFHYMLGFTWADRDWPRARRELERAAMAAPDDDVLFYNLGLLYWRHGSLDDAAIAFARSDAINPRHLASASRARAADRLAEVNAARARLRGAAPVSAP
jgi:hypothetical protein